MLPEQARLRKERREAKIKAGGSARLNKITGLGGGLQRDPIPSNSPSTASSPAPTTAARSDAAADQQHGDPDEVDISLSQHYYQPQTTNRIPPPPQALGGDNISEDQLRQIMLGFDGGRPAANPFLDPSALGGGAAGPDGEDPMLKMLSQMLGPGAVPPNLGGGGGAGANPFAGGANPFAGGLGGLGGLGGQQQQQQKAAPDSYTAAWRLLHFVLAAGLGLYIALLTSFSGTKIERERDAFASVTATAHGRADDDADSARRYFFWTFATAETVLLTTRFLLDKRRGAAPPGILQTVLGFVPEGKMKSLVGTGLKYSRIFSTVRSDILVCVFVLGACSWFRS
ncbi:hypothetical protein SLS53_002180 [Cytospora paraplurivora]|uniref:GET complex subunit GET2 n=1 Tax=Cytospora paraplurivora TaxID=2898453 RepID=A0AAN9UFZ9_9PEZI